MEHSAGIVIFRRHNGKFVFLLLHYNAGHFDFPKGHLEKGESNRDAAVRETLEETGISDVKILEGFKQKLGYYFTRDGKRTFKEVVYFAGETKSSDVKISAEHIGFEWQGYDDALKKITFKNSQEVLRKTMEFIEKIKKN